MKSKTFAVPRGMTAEEIKELRGQFGLSQVELAELLGCSRPTVERWERSKELITGPVVLLMELLRKHPEEVWQATVPPQETNLRIWYMYRQRPCTLIDVNETRRSVEIRNFTDNVMFRAFGVVEEPDYAAYEAFLESRCFPRERDKMKLVLADIGIPYYDPLLIVEKTEGRMAEDEFWLRVEWKNDRVV